MDKKTKSEEFEASLIKVRMPVIVIFNDIIELFTTNMMDVHSNFQKCLIGRYKDAILIDYLGKSWKIEDFKFSGYELSLLKRIFIKVKNIFTKDFNFIPARVTIQWKSENLTWIEQKDKIRNALLNDDFFLYTFMRAYKDDYEYLVTYERGKTSIQAQDPLATRKVFVDLYLGNKKTLRKILHILNDAGSIKVFIDNMIKCFERIASKSIYGI